MARLDRGARCAASGIGGHAAVVKIGVIVALLLGFAAVLAVAPSCDAPTFACVDDLVVGDGEWTCYCKADGLPCGGLGDCASSCPIE